MRNKLLTAAVLVGILLRAWRIVLDRRNRTHTNLSSTEALIRYASDQAVREAQEFDAITLDYSIDSLKQVDTILGRVHQLYVKNPTSVHTPGIALEYGAYVGEVIGGHETGAYWTQDGKVGPKTHPLHWKNGETFPLAWGEKRIINGDEDGWFKYTAIQTDLLGSANKKVSEAEQRK